MGNQQAADSLCVMKEEEGELCAYMQVAARHLQAAL